MKKKSSGRKPQKKNLTPLPKETAVLPLSILSSAVPSFPIVGIGASAGGLEALDQFLRHVPAGSGIAFVVIQHLDPTHKDIMVELLQRVTSMTVVGAMDTMKVKPDTVYVIPPNKDMSILHGRLYLIDPVAPRGLRLPIDFFFRSLADDRQNGSIGVILSGMGSDGTLGLRAIKEHAGVVLVQDPTSAKFDGMPRSAINAGLADVVAPVEELPGKILDYLKRVPAGSSADYLLADRYQSALGKVMVLLRTQTGHDFSLYKKNTMFRRIERRMGLHQLDNIEDYVRYLRENNQEGELLFKELLIGVTSFFRDSAVWEQLKSEAIPKLLTARPEGGPLRAWSVGCSSGEEAYSLAIVFKEALAQVKPAANYSLQIFATDLDKDAIDSARKGVFPANIAADVSEERLRRYFVPDDLGGFRVSKEIREMVTFATQNIVMDPPFTKLDILTCRNLFIYLVPELQKKLLPLFFYSLSPGGFLLMGSAETVGTASDLFAPVGGKTRLYRRLDSALQNKLVEFPSSFVSHKKVEEPSASVPSAKAVMAPNLQALTERLLLSRYSPASVLVTTKGDILYVNGKTGKYLEPAAGKANWNIFAMARDGLSSALLEAFHKAVRRTVTVTIKNLLVKSSGGTRALDLVVEPLTEPEAMRGLVMILFREMPALPTVKGSARNRPVSGHSARVSSLEQELRKVREELQASREELQSSNEEMQTTQEELKSANEELQSSNEELQSTNEELTTSKEEMQSMNEELQTVNHELQARVEELSRASDDMKNLLNSADIATLFLDDSLNVRMFTSRVASIIKLLPSDVGRPVTDIMSVLAYPDLAADALEVLRTLMFVEKQVATSDERWFTVRIMPYRTMDNKIDGVVITFADISVAKRLEAELRKAK